MLERCLIAASLAALVCHPSSSIKCFKPKPNHKYPPHKHQPKNPSPPPPKGSKSREEKPHQNAGSSSSTTSKSKKKTRTKPINVVSELVAGDPSVGVLETIFRSGWVGEKGLKIEKVLRVNPSLEVLHSFEKYRKMVKLKYEKGMILKRMERLVVDGNELLQFHAATITCSLGIDGFSSVCQRKCCQLCRILASEFSTEDGSMSFFDDSWKAHEKVTPKCVGKGVCARKAIVMCRVIAGHIGHYHAYRLVDNEEGDFDSAIEWTGKQFRESRELVVWNPEAVLPCFVIIYNVKNVA